VGLLGMITKASVALFSASVRPRPRGARSCAWVTLCCHHPQWPAAAAVSPRYVQPTSGALDLATSASQGLLNSAGLGGRAVRAVLPARALAALHDDEAYVRCKVESHVASVRCGRGGAEGCLRGKGGGEGEGIVCGCAGGCGRDGVRPRVGPGVTYRPPPPAPLLHTSSLQTPSPSLSLPQVLPPVLADTYTLHAVGGVVLAVDHGPVTSPAAAAAAATAGGAPGTAELFGGQLSAVVAVCDAGLGVFFDDAGVEDASLATACPEAPVAPGCGPRVRLVPAADLLEVCGGLRPCACAHRPSRPASVPTVRPWG
jgi:hypothetical protein